MLYNRYTTTYVIGMHFVDDYTNVAYGNLCMHTHTHELQYNILLCAYVHAGLTLSEAIGTLIAFGLLLSCCCCCCCFCAWTCNRAQEPQPK